MRRHRTLLDVIDAISEWTGKIVSFLIILMIGVIIWVAVLAPLFNLGGRQDSITTYANLLSVYIILGAAYALRTRAHVNIDILHRRFPLRTRALVDIATSTLFFIFVIILWWQLIEKAPWESLKLSPHLLAPPNWPVRLIWPVGIFLLLLQGLAKLARDVVSAITGEEVI